MNLSKTTEAQLHEIRYTDEYASLTQKIAAETEILRRELDMKNRAKL